MSALDPHTIPWKELIVPQAINFTIFVATLIYLVRKPIAEHFSNKRLSFEELRKKAEEETVLAERKNHEIKTQLRQLEEGAEQSLKKAKVESQEMIDQAIMEAKKGAAKAVQDAEKMVEFEYLRSITALREELIEKSTLLANQELKSRADEAAQLLVDEFVDKIQVAKT